jgi:hypothetical protein
VAPRYAMATGRHQRRDVEIRKTPRRCVHMKKITVRKAGSVRLTSAAQPLYGGCLNA